jgi:hypothetical protein
MSKNKSSESAPKPTSLSILKVRRTRRHVVIHYRNGEEEHQLKSRDNPLPDFDTSIAALVPIVLDVLHLPVSYGLENFKAMGLTVSDVGGNAQVCLCAQKQLPECNGPLNLATPLRLLDEPVAEGAVGKPLNDLQAEAVQEVIEQAKAYVRGDRAQGQIPLEEGSDEDPADNEDTEENNPDQSKLPLAAPEMEHNAPNRSTGSRPSGKRGRKSKAEPVATAAGK